MNRFKPRASVRTRIIMAGLLWSLIGLMLMLRGFLAINESGMQWLFLVAILLGVCKSNLVLDRVAEKNMNRISAKGENLCLGGVYSWQTWLLVLIMIIFGRLLRASSLPLWVVGSVYFTVGASLFWSSRKVWAILSDNKHDSKINSQ